MMLVYDPYYNAEVELLGQVRECMKELGYDTEEDEEEEPKAAVTVH